MNQGKICRICNTRSTKPDEMVHFYECKINANENGGTDKISYFEVIQQLTGVQMDIARNESCKLCAKCQYRIKFAYSVRMQLINSLKERKTTKKSVEVYQIVGTSEEGEELKFISGNEVIHNHNNAMTHGELIAIAGDEVEFQFQEEEGELITHDDVVNPKQEEYIIDGQLIDIDPQEEEEDDDEGEDAENEPLDAVSFLLEKKDLFKEKARADKMSSSKRIHQCQVCEKKFIRKSNLVDHLRLHANVRLYKCEYCDKSFVQAGNYRSHLRVHTKERPYQCTMCPKTYNQSSALKVHIRSHTNEKNYVCDVCEKRFTNSSDLNKHRRVHDPSLKIKCEHCDKTFAQRINLKNHVNRHHPPNAKIETN